MTVLGIGGVPTLLLQLLHVVPPLVGLVLVARVRTTRRWRTWALAAFALSAGLGLLSVLLTAGFLYGRVPYATGFGLLSTLMNLQSLGVGVLLVVAVVADRDDDAPAPGAPPVQPYPPAR